LRYGLLSTGFIPPVGQRNRREALIKALEGRVKMYYRFILSELLCLIDGVDESEEKMNHPGNGQGVHFSAGMWTIKVVPVPGSLCTEILPSCASTNALAMDNPRPKPAVDRDSSPR